MEDFILSFYNYFLVFLMGKYNNPVKILGATFVVALILVYFTKYAAKIAIQEEVKAEESDTITRLERELQFERELRSGSRTDRNAEIQELLEALHAQQIRTLIGYSKDDGARRGAGQPRKHHKQQLPGRSDELIAEGAKYHPDENGEYVMMNRDGSASTINQHELVTRRAKIDGKIIHLDDQVSRSGGSGMSSGSEVDGEVGDENYTFLGKAIQRRYTPYEEQTRRSGRVF